MFKSDELIYIQMQKTGCTHIAALLSGLFDGRMIGKHNPATPAQIATTPYFISSVRNPWDWYVSLWTYGLQGKGALMHRLTRRRLRNPMAALLSNPVDGLGAFADELSKDTGKWRGAYARDQDGESFRSWLRMIHDPGNRNLLGEGYGSAGIAGFCGFMTYRYLYLCCANADTLRKQAAIRDTDALAAFDRENCYIDFFIKQESLEETFCQAVEKIRPLTPEERQRIMGAPKTNTSRRKLTTADYYDRETIDLVHRRDRLLIDKFGYRPPEPAEQKTGS